MNARVKVPRLAHAAGVMARSKAGRILMMRRTDGQGWAFPGGGIKDGETADKAAWREFFEETGHRLGEVGPLHMKRTKDDGQGPVEFSTFVADVEDEFVPKLNHEHSCYAWLDPHALMADHVAPHAPQPAALYADEATQADDFGPGIRPEFKEEKHPRGAKGSGEKGGQFVKKGEEGVAGAEPPEKFEEPKKAPGPAEKRLRETQKPRTPEEQQRVLTEVHQRVEGQKQEQEQAGDKEQERAVELEEVKQKGKPKKEKVERKPTQRTNVAPPTQPSGRFSASEVRSLTNHDLMRQPQKERGTLNKGRVGDQLAARSQKFIKEKFGFEDGKITRERAEKNPEINDLLATAIASEVMDELSHKGKLSAQNWYREKFDQAIHVAALVHPELLTSDKHRTAFAVAMAITSQGQKVDANAGFANTMYKGWKANGERFDVSTNPGVDKWDSGIKANFEKYNGLVDKLGDEDARKFLATEYKVSDLRADKWVIPNAQNDDYVYGSAIFGQKIGNGFFQNLSGNFNPVTQDMWFMRTFGRMTGTIRDVVDDKEGSYKRFKSAMKADGRELPDDLDEDGIWNAATARHSEHQKDYAKDREKYDKGKKFIDDNTARLKDEAAKAALEETARTGKPSKIKGKKYMSLDKLLKDHPELKDQVPKDAKFKSKSALASKSVFDIANGVQDNPGGGADRAWRSKLVNMAREKLAEQGVEMDNASLQAVIWYPEKDVFEHLGGVGETSTEVPDYAAALSKVAKAEGHDDAAIQSAIASATAGARHGGGPGDANAAPERPGPGGGDDAGGDRGGGGEHPPAHAGQGRKGDAGPGGRRVRGAAGPGRQDDGRGSGPGDLEIPPAVMDAIADAIDRLDARLRAYE